MIGSVQPHLEEGEGRRHISASILSSTTDIHAAAALRASEAIVCLRSSICHEIQNTDKFAQWMLTLRTVVGPRMAATSSRARVFGQHWRLRRLD